MSRLKGEYHVEAQYEPISIQIARWIFCEDAKVLEAFKKKYVAQLDRDSNGYLTCLAPAQVNLSFTQERCPDIRFQAMLEK